MAYTDLATNLLGGFKTGYGIGSDIRQRDKENQFTSDIAQAQADAGDPNSAGYADRLGSGLQTAYFKHGDPTGGFQAAEAARGQFKGRLEDNFKQIYTLADAGTPEAMARANELMKSTNDMWPSGHALHAVHDPQSNLIHAQTLSEATGQPTGQPMTFDAPTLKEMARAYLTDVSKMTDQELVRKGQDQQKAIADREAELRAQEIANTRAYQLGSLGLEGQRVGIAARGAAAEEGRLTLAQTQAAQEERQRQFEREQATAKFAAEGPGREAGVMKDLAYTDYLLAGGKAGKRAGIGTGPTAADVNSAEDNLRNIVTHDPDFTNVGGDPIAGTDPNGLASAMMQAISVNGGPARTPTSVAYSFVKRMHKDQSKFAAETVAAPDGTVNVVDLTSGEHMRIPKQVLPLITGKPNAPPPATPTPGIGAG